MPSLDRTQTLVLDTAPLLTSSLTSLLALSDRFITTKEVIEEVKEKGQRERLDQEWKILDATLNAKSNDHMKDDHTQWKGLQVRQPSMIGISKIKEFAVKTGDIAVLSSADIGVLALAYDIEVEANGTWRLRDQVGGKRMGKDPEKKKARLLRKQQKEVDNDNPKSESDFQPSPDSILSKSALEPKPSLEQESSKSFSISDDVDQLSIQTYSLDLNGSQIDKPKSIVTQAASTQQTPAQYPDHENPALPDTNSDTDWVQIPTKQNIQSSEDEDASDISSFISASDPSWITPENLHIHQAKDMGFFPSLEPKPSTLSATTFKPPIENNQPSSSTITDVNPEDPCSNTSPRPAPTTTTTDEISSKPVTLKAALLTGDFAMQNVALQIGLNVFGVGGKRVRDVKTWVLRCYGCFKLCKDPTRKFCPTCGGPTLTRVSITYTPSSPTGYVLHLKSNFQYRNRGTIYSIPSAKPGSASFDKGSKRHKSVNGATLILREDQKEFQRGLKSVSIQKQKEERQLIKSNQEKQRTGASGSYQNWVGHDSSWEPPMFQGEKGRTGNGRSRHQPHQIRYGKDGLPIIGFGKNPNQVKKHV